MTMDDIVRDFADGIAFRLGLHKLSRGSSLHHIGLVLMDWHLRPGKQFR
jgi:hypothetical protein